MIGVAFGAVVTALFLLLKLMLYIVVLIGKMAMLIMKGILVCIVKILTPNPRLQQKTNKTKPALTKKEKQPKKEKAIDENEQLSARSQFEAWQSQLDANIEYMRELDKELEQAKKSYETVVNGIVVTVNPDKMKIAKIKKKISAVEAQSASIEMRMMKVGNKYNLQRELEQFR